MDTKYAIVVDGYGDKVEFVMLESIEQDGILVEKPHAYVLKPEESLICNDISVALSMRKPRWNGAAWEETATTEEIEAHRQAMLERTC